MFVLLLLHSSYFSFHFFYIDLFTFNFIFILLVYLYIEKKDKEEKRRTGGLRGKVLMWNSNFLKMKRLCSKKDEGEITKNEK